MQETWVRFLLWEDLTCQGATKLMKDRYWACGAKLLKAVCLELVLHNKRSHRNEKPCTLQAESSPYLSQIEKWPYRKPTQCSQKKKKPLPLSLWTLKHHWRVMYISHVKEHSRKLRRRKISSEGSQTLSICFLTESSHFESFPNMMNGVASSLSLWHLTWNHTVDPFPLI